EVHRLDLAFVLDSRRDRRPLLDRTDLLLHLLVDNRSVLVAPTLHLKHLHVEPSREARPPNGAAMRECPLCGCETARASPLLVLFAAGTGRTINSGGCSVSESAFVGYDVHGPVRLRILSDRLEVDRARSNEQTEV